jgi:hypothetical protein
MIGRTEECQCSGYIDTSSGLICFEGSKAGVGGSEDELRGSRPDSGSSMAPGLEESMPGLNEVLGMSSLVLRGMGGSDSLRATLACFAMRTTRCWYAVT